MRQHADPDNSGQCIYCGYILDVLDDMDKHKNRNLEILGESCERSLPGDREFCKAWIKRLEINGFHVHAAVLSRLLADLSDLEQIYKIAFDAMEEGGGI